MKKHTGQWCVAMLCLAAFILLCTNLSQWTGVDMAVYGFLRSLHSPAMNVAMFICTMLAGPAWLLMVALCVTWRIKPKEYRVPLMLNLSVSVLLNLGLKNVFARPRPEDVLHLVTESGSSFPSGHTMAATCFYGFLIYLTWQLCRKKALRNALTALLSVIILLVATSRVYLGAHYFSDVLGGVLISIPYLFVFTTFVDRFFAHKESLNPRNLQPNEHNRLVFSFLYAFEGVLAGLRTERNMVIHFAAVATVIVFGGLLNISQSEWIACIILCGLVVMAELMNTAIETVVDMICPEKDPRAKLAKDTAAGAVLMVALAAAVVGAIIFLPKLVTLIQMQM